MTALTTATPAEVEATVAEMDQLVMGLIDISDDIHAAVVWLAEHWSVHLPAPLWFGSNHQMTDGEALRLLAACNEPQLARVAELTGVTPVDDRRPDALGHQYRRVHYRFGTGRVLLDAFCRLDTEAVR